jgi:RNA polymerase sigma-70 factor, ECF subfamily
MREASRLEVRAGLQPCLAQLRRCALILSRANDAADDLVLATCVRAIERADQFALGTRLNRWPFCEDDARLRYPIDRNLSRRSHSW